MIFFLPNERNRIIPINEYFSAILLLVGGGGI